MCLIVFRWNPLFERPLILLSNRDEFYQRPSQTAHFWPEHPSIFGGRDEEKKGTWLAVSKTGRMACVTNYRDGQAPSQTRSRGEIPWMFLDGNLSAEAFSEKLSKEHETFPGFNALFYDGESLVYSGNRDVASPRKLSAGTYGVSNHVLDTPWPKLARIKSRFTDCLEQLKDTDEKRSEKLLELMADHHIAPDESLPDTGVGLEIERMLSPIFIESPAYGTRTSTLLEFLQQEKILFSERNYDPQAQRHSTCFFEILTAGNERG